jgi:hypothetical protein
MPEMPEMPGDIGQRAQTIPKPQDLKQPQAHSKSRLRSQLTWFGCERLLTGM